MFKKKVKKRENVDRVMRKGGQKKRSASIVTSLWYKLPKPREARALTYRMFRAWTALILSWQL